MRKPWFVFAAHALQRQAVLGARQGAGRAPNPDAHSPPCAAARQARGGGQLAPPGHRQAERDRRRKHDPPDPPRKRGAHCTMTQPIHLPCHRACLLLEEPGPPRTRVRPRSRATPGTSSNPHASHTAHPAERTQARIHAAPEQTPSQAPPPSQTPPKPPIHVTQILNQITGELECRTQGCPKCVVT